METFAINAPGATVLIVAIVGACWIIGKVCELRRATLRTRNIEKHGWPPPHVDAEGKLNPYEEEETG